MDVVRADEDGDNEPPYVRQMSDDRLESLYMTPLKTGVLCHSQHNPVLQNLPIFEELAWSLAPQTRTELPPGRAAIY